MPEFDSHTPGTFCWAELVTTDAEAAKRFYCILLGWASQDDPVDPDAVYTTLLNRAKTVAALYQRSAEQEARGVLPRWGSYVTVDDVDAVSARVEALGGEVMVEAFDVFDIGRMSVFQDPTGAMLSLWQPKKSAGAQLRDEPGALCWNELQTPDPEQARTFYTELFQWTTKKDKTGQRPYTTFLSQDRPTAGLLDVSARSGDTEAQWLPYFEVPSCSETAKLAATMGAEVLVSPTTIPDVGTYAVIRDPQEAVFGVVSEGA